MEGTVNNVYNEEECMNSSKNILLKLVSLIQIFL